MEEGDDELRAIPIGGLGSKSRAFVVVSNKWSEQSSSERAVVRFVMKSCEAMRTIAHEPRPPNNVIMINVGKEYAFHNDFTEISTTG
ncbi:hypothetical protein NFJ02_08g136580 [Pycnococcus provasolii]